MTTKYALIIEGSWCGKTHIHGVYEDFYDVMIAVRDFIEDYYEDEEKWDRLLMEFADNDFSFIDGLLSVDKIEICAKWLLTISWKYGIIKLKKRKRGKSKWKRFILCLMRTTWL